MYVGPSTTFRQQLLESYHHSAVGGYSGINVTHIKLKRYFYWPVLLKDIMQWVQSCEVCARCKGEHWSYARLLQPLLVPSQAWQEISMDFIEGLPKSKGKHVILVVVCRLTKTTHFLPLAHLFSSPTVFKLHGVSQVIVSYRDKAFTSLFWQEFFKTIGVTFNSSYHPQSGIRLKESTNV